MNDYETRLFDLAILNLASFETLKRSLSNMSLDELIALGDFYARQVLAEKRNKRITN